MELTRLRTMSGPASSLTTIASRSRIHAGSGRGAWYEVGHPGRCLRGVVRRRPASGACRGTPRRRERRLTRSEAPGAADWAQDRQHHGLRGGAACHPTWRNLRLLRIEVEHCDVEALLHGGDREVERKCGLPGAALHADDCNGSRGVPLFACSFCAPDERVLHEPLSAGFGLIRRSGLCRPGDSRTHKARQRPRRLRTGLTSSPTSSTSSPYLRRTTPGCALPAPPCAAASRPTWTT